MDAVKRAVWLDAGRMLEAGIRQDDVDEWVAGSGTTVRLSLLAALEHSLMSRTLFIGGVPTAMWGVQRTELEGMRQVWFIATKGAPRHAITVHRHFREAIAELQPPGIHLRACTYWRNTKHHRWLEAHGWGMAGRSISALGVPYFTYVRPPSAAA